MSKKYKIITKDKKLIIYTSKPLYHPDIIDILHEKLTSDIRKLMLKSKYIVRIYKWSDIWKIIKYVRYKKNEENPIKEFKEMRAKASDYGKYNFIRFNMIVAEFLRKKFIHLFNKREVYVHEVFDMPFTDEDIEMFYDSIPSSAKIVIPFFKGYTLDVRRELLEDMVEEYKIGNFDSVKIYKSRDYYYCIFKPLEESIAYRRFDILLDYIKEIEKFGEDKEKIKRYIEEIPDEKIKEVVLRNTIGLGILDMLFKDPNIQDVYVYSNKKRIQINHAKYGNCLTNLALTKKGIKSIETKIRAISGRPFDESFPVIDYEIDNVRICGVMEPLTYNGTGYAFRKHRQIPWTLSKLVETEMIDMDISGLINFLVNSNVSILITGPRGSGKTTLLSAMLAELTPSERIIVIEDTPELPVKKLIKAGLNIEHLRVRPQSREEGTLYELTAEEALRTALRLGDSVLVIGEVRGKEAKTLFEAMRIGSAGNIVLGTIHGNTPYDTFDRIVNDLGVSPSSFKAIDVIITCGKIKSPNVKNKRVVKSIVEVTKRWDKEPKFVELARYKNGVMELNMENIINSELIKRIAEEKEKPLIDVLRELMVRTNICCNSVHIKTKIETINSAINLTAEDVELIRKRSPNGVCLKQKYEPVNMFCMFHGRKKLLVYDPREFITGRFKPKKGKTSKI